MKPRHGSEMKAGIPGKTAPSGAALRLRLAEVPDGDAELLGLVGEVCGNPRAREDHDADRQSFEHLVVALEGCGVAVPVPVGLEDDLWNFAIVGPAGGDALGAARTAAVQEDHVGMLGADLVEGVPDAVDIVAVGAAGEGDAGAGGSVDFGLGASPGGRESRLSMPAYFFRSEPGAAELRRLARRESGRVCQRVLMIANMLEGMEHGDAARLAGLSRAAAYEWHTRYEEDGIEGLRDRPRPGRQPRVDAETSARFKERIVAGAELQRDGVVAFRAVDAQRILKEEFEIDCSLSSTYRLLHRIKLSWLAPRPRHPQADATAQAAFSQRLDCN